MDSLVETSTEQRKPGNGAGLQVNVVRNPENACENRKLRDRRQLAGDVSEPVKLRVPWLVAPELLPASHQDHGHILSVHNTVPVT